MTAATVTSFEGVLWRHSAPAAAPLWVALQLRSKNRLAATVLAAICAFALTLTAAPQVTSVSLFGSETGVAAQTDPTHALVGVETPVSPTAVGGNGAHSYDGVSGCCVAPNGAGGDLVDLHRAPQPGQATGPLDPADFPGSFANGVPDGRSYWTLNWELADEYAAAYGTDVISASIPRGGYDAMLDVLKHAPGAGEFPYPGPGGFVEVAIPCWMVPWLNNFGPG